MSMKLLVAILLFGIGFTLLPLEGSLRAERLQMKYGGSRVTFQLRDAIGQNLAIALLAAAAGALLAIPLTSRWKLQAAAGLDLSPAMHWRTPVFAHKVDRDQGPVLVTIEYHVDKPNCAAFLGAIDEMGRERKRDGAFAWGVFEDAAESGRFLETFLIGSWLEMQYLRERVTNADRMLENEIRQLLAASPKITMLTASARTRRSGRKHRFELPAPTTPSI